MAEQVEPDYHSVDIGPFYADALEMLPALWSEASQRGLDPSKLCLDLIDEGNVVLMSVRFTDLLARASGLS